MSLEDESDSRPNLRYVPDDVSEPIARPTHADPIPLQANARMCCLRSSERAPSLGGDAIQDHLRGVLQGGAEKCPAGYSFSLWRFVWQGTETLVYACGVFRSMAQPSPLANRARLQVADLDMRRIRWRARRYS